MRTPSILSLLFASFLLNAQDNTLDLLRDQLNRVNPNPASVSDLSDPAARLREIQRLPLNADPKLSLGEIQSAQTSLQRLNDMLNAAAAARTAESPAIVLPVTPRVPVYRPAAPRLSSPNLALAKPTRQSSVRYFGSRGGVDGLVTGTFGFYTELEPKPWWEVDLQQSAKIAAIRIFNSRINPERARTLQVLLSNDGTTWNTVYTHNGQPFGATGLPLTIPLDSVTARWVRVQLTEPNHLHLDEIEVYAASPE